MAKKVIPSTPVDAILGKFNQSNEPSVAEEMLEDLESVEARKPERTNKAPEGYKLDPKYVEVKSQRVQLVLKPSVFKALKKYCKTNKVSVNEYVGTLLEEQLKER